MRASRLLLSILLTVLVAACGVGFDEHTGGDGTRGEAQTVPVDQAVDDRVSADEGDHTDWKKFVLDAEAKITVKLWWDDARASANVTVRDELGQRVESVAVASGTREASLGPVLLKAGTYYLEIEGKSGSSVYTFEIQTGSTGAVPVPDF